MFDLSLAPAYGQAHPEMYKEAFGSDKRFEINEIVERAVDFVDRTIPFYSEAPACPKKAEEILEGCCIARACTLHTLFAPFGHLDPFIELRTDSNQHASNIVAENQGTATVDVDNNWDSLPSTMENPSLAEKLRLYTTIHGEVPEGIGTLSIVRSPVQIADLKSRQRREEVHAKIRDAENARGGTLTPFPEVDVRFWNQRIDRDTGSVIIVEQRHLILPRLAANFLVDALSKSERSPAHKQTVLGLNLLMGQA
ncbi:hypothetical protein KC992_03620 [Candidatus Saccharibacteria bacterium]|nr:hypothetical protein [Candidatus Saccharibacteria bacterium]MCA9328936.1 hypothetical protein [Candidatus Saccharibacteria bacterium]